MEISLAVLAAVVLSLSIGSVMGYFARQTIAKKQLSTAEGKVSKMLEEAEKEMREINLNAKNKAVEILEDAKKKEKNKEDQIMRMEQRLEKREETLDRKMEELEIGKGVLEKKALEIKEIHRGKQRFVFKKRPVLYGKSNAGKILVNYFSRPQS